MPWVSESGVGPSRKGATFGRRLVLWTAVHLEKVRPASQQFRAGEKYTVRRGIAGEVGLWANYVAPSPQAWSPGREPHDGLRGLLARAGAHCPTVQHHDGAKTNHILPMDFCRRPTPCECCMNGMSALGQGVCRRWQASTSTLPLALFFLGDFAQGHPGWIQGWLDPGEKGT